MDLLQGLLNSEIGVLDLIAMLLQQRIEHVSSVYTCNTYLLMHWSMYFIRQCLVNVRL